MYTKIEEAFLFMVKANKGLRLKIENVDRSFHNFGVYELMRELSTDEDVLVTALLHDIIHYTDYGYEEIEAIFGSVVADKIAELNEDMSIAKWFLRKKDYIQRMKKITDVDSIHIMLADKLHILLMLYSSFKKNGDKVWKLTGGTKIENSYIYRELYIIGRRNNANEKLLERYRQLITLYFGALDE